MGITFKVKASDLNAAIEVASIVPPKPFDKQGSSGYLFVIRGDTGYVYSRDAQHVSRAHFPLIEVEGEGPFIYPAAFIGSFSSFTDDVLTFEVKNDDDNFVVKYTAMDGKAWEERPTFDHRQLQTCDKELTAATNERTFPVPILREALSQSRNFTETKDSKVDEKHKTVQIFDKNLEVDDPKNPGQKIRPCEKGDGSLFASNGIQAFYFYSDAFRDRHLMVHSAHLPLLQSFLAKATGDITLKTGGNMTFAVDAAGQVLGWTHSNTGGIQKYAYYPLANDTHVVLLSRGPVLHALKHVKKMLDERRFKVKLNFDGTENTIQFQVQEGSGKGQSWPVGYVVKKDETKENKSFSLSVNVEHFIDLFEGCKSNEVELRITYLPAGEKRPKEQGLFRTVDEFILDQTGKVIGGSNVEKVPEGGIQCKVTRFMPSMV